MATYTRKKADDILNKIGASGLTQQSLAESNKFGVANGIVGTAKRGVGSNLGASIDNTSELISSVAKPVSTVLFGESNQRNQASSGSQGTDAVQTAPTAFGGVLSKEQQGNGVPTLPTPSSTPSTDLPKQTLGVAPNSITYGSATPQQIASRTGFQLEQETPQQTGTPIRGIGGKITSYSDPNYSDRSVNATPNTVSFSNGNGGTASITSNKVFSPDQIDGLNKTIEYNNRPETIKNFAEQAAISQARYDAIKPDPTEAINNKLEAAYRRNDKTGIALYKDLLVTKTKDLTDRAQLGTQEKIGLANNAAQQASLDRQLLKDSYDTQFKQNDATQKNSLAAVNIIKDLEKEGNTNAFQQLAAVKKATGRLDLGTLDRTFGGRPGYVEARKLGSSALAEWVNTQDDAPPVEFMNEIFKRS